jgi:hypothetical protein
MFIDSFMGYDIAQYLLSSIYCAINIVHVGAPLA